jgi:hypothetical protein
MNLLPILGLSAIFILSGCKSSDDKTTLRGETIRELTEADLAKVEKFGEKFAQDATEGNAAKVARAFNARGYFLRSLDGIEFPPSEFEEFMSGVIKGTNQRAGGLGWGVLNEQLDYVKLLDFQGMKMPLFRFNEEGGFGYMIIMALPDASGEVKAYDTYMLSNGDWSSMTTRRLILPTIKQLPGSKFTRAFKKKDEADISNHLETIKAINNASQTGDINALQNAYRALPDKLQKERFFWSTYLNSLVDNVDAHLKESLKFEAAFPDDAGVALMLLDADFNREDWDGTHRKLDTIRKFVDGDHYLDYYDSLIYILAEDFKRGVEMVDKALEASPQSEDYWWSKITCLTELEEHQKLLTLLEDYEKQFEVRLTKEDFNEGFLDKFIASPEGKAYFGG